MMGLGWKSEMEQWDGKGKKSKKTSNDRLQRDKRVKKENKTDRDAHPETD